MSIVMVLIACFSDSEIECTDTKNESVQRCHNKGLIVICSLLHCMIER